jgi:sialate O-acetylesterase
MLRLVLISLLCLVARISLADVSLPKIFSDNMVLQRDQNIVIWGWASPREKVAVSLNKQTISVVTGKDGKWKITLKPERAGGPFVLKINGKNEITFRDVLIGDVWICSGQSNMEWPVNSSDKAMVEIQNGNYPLIRHIKVPISIAGEPQSDIKDTRWKVCSSANVGEFTAVGYFFARELFTNLTIPIGLINTTWGGTHSETWTSREGFENSEDFREMIKSMPVLNLDSLGKMKYRETLARIVKVQGELVTDPQQISEWKNPDYNDGTWSTMNVPMQWEGQGLGEFDGKVWLRKSFEVYKNDAGKPAQLNLAMIDDSDETYVNGVKVGSTIQKWNEKRKYAIPAGVLKEGRNVIAVRVDDTGGGGGIHGDAADVNLWIGESSMSLAGKWAYKVESMLSGFAALSPNSYPTLLFNAMVNPLIPYGMKGVIWYQGEANAGRAYQYRKAFPLMINDWRKHWGQGDFPFYFVQLASFNAANGNSANGSMWAELREAQAMTLSLPNTGMAVTTDIGEPADIHPRNKQDVGKRLAAIALKNAYGKNIVDSGPVFQSMEIQGNKVIATFQNTGTGLMAKDRYGYVRGFEISGSDKKFVYAQASIEGDKILISAAGIEHPVAIRFGWADDASDTNLFNKEGFPAVPFRTDKDPGITAENKFSIGN